MVCAICLYVSLCKTNFWWLKRCIILVGLSYGCVNDIDHCSSARNCSVSIFVVCLLLMWCLVDCDLCIYDYWSCVVYDIWSRGLYRIESYTDNGCYIYCQFTNSHFFQINRDRVCFESNWQVKMSWKRTHDWKWGFHIEESSPSKHNTACGRVRHTLRAISSHGTDQG